MSDKLNAKEFIDEVTKSMEKEKAENENQKAEAEDKGEFVEKPEPDAEATEEDKPVEVEEDKKDPEDKPAEDVEKSVDDDKVEASDVEAPKEEATEDKKEDVSEETKEEKVVEKSNIDLDQFAEVLSTIAKSYASLQETVEKSIHSIEERMDQIQTNQTLQATEINKSFLDVATTDSKEEAPVSKAVGYATKNTEVNDEDVDKEEKVEKSVSENVTKAYTFENPAERDEFREKLFKGIKQEKISKNDSDDLKAMYLTAIDKQASEDTMKKLNEFMLK